jgi:hypothetical protein
MSLTHAELKNPSFDCGCETRKETIGEDKWWTGCMIAGSVLILAFAYGGSVTAQTKQILKIAAAGAIVAVIADRFVNPAVKG